MLPEMAAKRAKGPGWGGTRKHAGRPAQFADAADRTIRFERADLDELDALARDRDVTGADLIREAVAQYLARRRRK